VTAGQSPIFLDDQNALSALTQNDFDSRQVVFLPPETQTTVPITNQTRVTILHCDFGLQSVNIKAEASVPSLVVVAQTYYHNWQAEVDGAPTPLLRANLAFQAVQMPAGKHTIRIFYHDRAFEIGAAISLCMWANCGIGLLLFLRRSLPPTPPDPEDEDNYL
jgi:hypothetical protein